MAALCTSSALLLLVRTSCADCTFCCQCYWLPPTDILAGWGLVVDPNDFNKFKAVVPCPPNTYGELPGHHPLGKATKPGCDTATALRASFQLSSCMLQHDQLLSCMLFCFPTQSHATVQTELCVATSIHGGHNNCCCLFVVHQLYVCLHRCQACCSVAHSTQDIIDDKSHPSRHSFVVTYTSWSMLSFASNSLVFLLLQVLLTRPTASSVLLARHAPRTASHTRALPATLIAKTLQDLDTQVKVPTSEFTTAILSQTFVATPACSVVPQ